MWQSPCESEASSDQDICIKRRSACELEGDASLDGLFDFTVILLNILNIVFVVHVRIVLHFDLQRLLTGSLNFIPLSLKSVQM